MRNNKVIFILLIAMLTTLFPVQVFADDVIADTVYVNGIFTLLMKTFLKHKPLQ